VFDIWLGKFKGYASFSGSDAVCVHHSAVGRAWMYDMPSVLIGSRNMKTKMASAVTNKTKTMKFLVISLNKGVTMVDVRFL
jgi:hypothetical protein